MLSALIIPSEFPPSLLEIKRALLTYDRVQLIDPSERDIFAPESMLLAMGLPPLFSMPGPPMRVLGKIPGYDSAFEQRISELRPALEQGTVEVIRTYPASKQQITIGSVPLRALNPRFVLGAYRQSAAEEDYLQAALRNDTQLHSLGDDDVAAIAVREGLADGSINSSPALGDLSGPLRRENLRAELSAIARARVGATIKSIAYCAVRDVLPYSSSPAHHGIVRHMTELASQLVDKCSDGEPSWINREQALRIAHTEYLDEDVLDKISISDTLKLRTRAWGQQADARDALLGSIADLAREIGNVADFEKQCAERIQAYRSQIEAVECEREQLHMRISCDIGAGIAGTGAAVTAGVATLLLGGCVLAFEKLKDYSQALSSLRRAEQEISRNACFGIHKFYFGESG